jgi:hypothetical protein
VKVIAVLPPKLPTALLVVVPSTGPCAVVLAACHIRAVRPRWSGDTPISMMETT